MSGHHAGALIHKCVSKLASAGALAQENHKRAELCSSIMEISTKEEDVKAESVMGEKKTVEITAACIATTIVSVAMIILNKAVVLNIPFSGGLVLIQNIATVLIVQAYRCFSHPPDIEWKTIRDSIPCAILFGANTFTSMQALSYLSVTAFTIFRNTQSVISYPLDYLLRGERLKPVSIYLLLTILIGTCAFCGKEIRTNIEGVLWASAHIVSSTLYAVLIKIRTQTTEFKENPITRTLEMAWFNNMLSLPIVGGAAAIQAVYMKPPLIQSTCGVNCWVMVATSCITGCAMSIVGLKTQALLSPVTFLTFNNLNKIPAMLISSVIWPHLETADTILEVMGIVLSVYGGYLFAISKQGDVHPMAIFVSVVLCLALVPLIVLGENAGQQLLLHFNTTGNQP